MNFQSELSEIQSIFAQWQAFELAVNPEFSNVGSIPVKRSSSKEPVHAETIKLLYSSISKVSKSLEKVSVLNSRFLEVERKLEYP